MQCLNAISRTAAFRDRMIYVHFLAKLFNVTVIQVYAPTSNAEEAEVERFYEDLLELTPQKDVLFIIGDWNARVGSQETPRVTGKFGLGVQNEAGQRPREHTGHSKHPLPTTQKKNLVSSLGHHGHRRYST